MEDNQQMHPIEAIIRLVIGGGLLLIPFFFAFQTCSESDEKELRIQKLMLVHIQQQILRVQT